MTIPVYPQRIVIEYYSTGTWNDISDYVVSDINGNSGFESYSPDDRVAYMGLLDFQLDNTGKLFSPMGGDSVRGLSTLAGWRKGTKIRIRTQFGGEDTSTWVGFIIDLQTDPGNKGSQRVSVVCADWMDIAVRYPMRRTDILVDATIDEAMDAIVSRISIPPEGTNFDAGDNTFAAIFDNVKDKTKAIGEMNKLALSELGYIYVLRDGYLRVENSTARKGTRPLDTTHVPVDHSAALLWDGTGTMNGNVALQENGEVILVDEQRVPSLSTTMLDLNIGLEKNFINSAYVRAYPARVDTSLQNVFVLNKPIKIAAGVTRRIQGTYANPNGGSPINATNLQTPVATTDYQMFSGISGTYYGIGTDLTANLFVTATYYGDIVDYELTNSGTTAGHITKLNARGYGIYRESTLYGEVSDQDAIDRDGDASIDIEQKYSDDVYAGLAYIKSVVEQYKDPKSKVFNAKFAANYSVDHMLAFTQLDVGDLIAVTEERSMLTNYYYIIKRSFKIAHGGIITFALVLAQALSISSGALNPVAVEFGGEPTTDAVDFGYLPHLVDLPERTISVWISPEQSATTDLVDFIGGMFSDDASFGIYWGDNNQSLFMYQKYSPVGQGIWSTPANSVPTGTWSHVVVFKDLHSDTHPIMYINGTLQTVSVVGTPAPAGRTAFSEEGVNLIIGNVNTATIKYGWPFGGKIFDFRIYDRKVTSSEVTTLYNNGTLSMTAGPQDMVFQAFAIDADLGNAASLNGQQIPSGHKYFDNVLKYIGEPNGSPLIRATP